MPPEIDPNSTISIIRLISEGGAFVLLTFIIVYAAVKVFPAIRIERENDRISFSNSISQLTQAFSENMKYEREQCSNQFNTILEITQRAYQDFKKGK